MARLRSRASFGALALLLAATGCKFTGWGDASAIGTAHSARNWLVTTQLADGSFEVAGFAGFETADAVAGDRRGRASPAGGGTPARRAPRCRR